MQRMSYFYLFFITFFSNSICVAQNQLSQVFKISSTVTVVIEKGDITQCQTEAIVNAANEQLAGGGGVCGAIFKAAGWQELQAACDIYPKNNGVRCPVGQARITDSFKLKSRGIKHIVHAVGPNCGVIKDEHQQNSLLESAYKNSLILADQYTIKSIAFPFISSAIYAFPKERAARIALKTILEYSRNTQITSIYFMLFSEQDHALFCKVIKELLFDRAK